MGTVSQEETSDPIGNVPYLLFLDKEIKEAGGEVIQTEFCNAFKDLLISPTDIARTIAQRIDAVYWEILLPADPLMKYHDDKGMAGFLNALWEFFFELSKHITYDDSKQDTLIQFITELRKLPPKPFKVWIEDCLVYSREPIFLAVMNEHWNGSYINEDGNWQHFKEQYDQWINFSSFVARVEDSRLDIQYPNPGTYARRDIQRGLDEKLQPGPQRDCDFMVAAQYILIAHSAVYEHNIMDEEKAKAWALEKWPVWVKRLEELAVEYDNLGNPELAAMARGAHEKLSLYRV